MTSKENMELIFQHKMPEYVPHAGYDSYQIYDGCVERPLTETGYDAWGCHWISCPDSLGITHPDTKYILFDTLENWESKVKFPDLDTFDLSPLVEKAATFTDRDQKMVQYISLNGIFERSHAFMGFENALCACLEEPEEYERMVTKFADHKIRLFKKVYDICQPDLVMYHDDMGSQSSQFLPTYVYEDILFPQYKRIVDAAREIGYKHVIHHSCGKIDALMDKWIKIGFDGWHSVMPCNDLKMIKEKYGNRIVFMSGLDTQNILGNPNATRKQIEHMVVDWLELLGGDGTGFIIDSKASLSLNPKNEEICLEFALKHGKPFMDAKRAGVPYVPNYEE